VTTGLVGEAFPALPRPRRATRSTHGRRLPRRPGMQPQRGSPPLRPRGPAR
jgi:hypothetical protein